MGVWAFFDVTLLAAGAVSLALSIVWMKPNLLLNVVLTTGDLNAGTVLGVALLVTFAISIGGIVQRNHITLGLVILNWSLILDAIGIVVIGTFVWFYTLRERNEYRMVFSQQSVQNQIAIQDKFKCCGYFNSSDLLQIGGNICSSQAAADQVNNACVGPITSFADSMLNDIFTTVYGFMAIALCLLLATLCVIKKRQEDERFKKIDEKRGGKGFV